MTTQPNTIESARRKDTMDIRSESAAPSTDELEAWVEERGAYSVRFARSPEDRRRVQALRFEIFALELGAHLEGAEFGLDIDPLDDRVDHLMVLELETDACVGSYRLATLEQVGHDPGFYTQRIFDMDGLEPGILREGVELGRACVAVQHRTRGVLQLLLRGIGAYLHQTQKRFLFGCGSIPLKDPGQMQLAIAQIEREGWIDSELAVRPTPSYAPRFSESATGASPEIPALLYAYSSIGAQLASAPAFDPDFKTLDFFVLLDLERVEPRTYARYCKPR